MSDDPARLLANAIFAPSGDHAGSIWKKRPAGDDVSTSVLREPLLTSSVGIHRVDRVVAVPSAHEEKIGPRISASSPAGGQHERRAHGQEQEESDVHRFEEPRARLVGQRLDAKVPAL